MCRYALRGQTTLLIFHCCITLLLPLDLYMYTVYVIHTHTSYTSPPQVFWHPTLQLSMNTYLRSSLSCNYLPLQRIPPDIANLKFLQTLDLSGNKLRSLPAELGDMTHLRELLLNNNTLRVLPYEIGKLFLLQVGALEWRNAAVVCGGWVDVITLLFELCKRRVMKYTLLNAKGSNYW